MTAGQARGGRRRRAKLRAEFQRVREMQHATDLRILANVRESQGRKASKEAAAAAGVGGGS